MGSCRQADPDLVGLNDAIAAGCSALPVGESGDQYRERDSSGVRIIENALPGDEESPLHRVLVAIITVLPYSGTDAQLSGRIVSAVRTRTGNLVIADARTSSLALFDSTGRFVKLLGRKGDGPGEYQGIVAMLRGPGDTIGVVDLHYGRRISFIRENGEYLSRTLLPIEPLVPGETALGFATGHERFIAGMLSHDSLVVFTRTALTRIAPAPGGTAVHHDTLNVQLLDIPGGSTTRLFSLPHGTIFSYASRDRLLWSGLLPLDPRGIVVAGAGMVATSSGEFYSVNIYKSGKGLSHIIRLCTLPRTVTSSDHDRVMRAEIAANGPRFTAVIQGAHSRAPKTEKLPAISKLHVDEQGRLWIGQFRLPGDPQKWFVFDSLGHLERRFQVDPSIDLVQVSGSHVVGIETDEDGLQKAIVYSVGPGLR